METHLAESDWAVMPERHNAFLRSALALLREDQRMIGLLAGGSFVRGVLDEQSDLDLILPCAPEACEEVMASRIRIAESLGDLLSAFTGEHVGEPRLIICLYGPQPLLHVDLKFIGVNDLADRVEDPVILWSRDDRIKDALARGEAHYPQPDLQWIEDRIWVWTHYIAAKIDRGELFEVIDGLSYIRSRVLGPLILMEGGEQPSGVRRIEAVAAPYVEPMCRTLADHDAASCREALRATVELYCALRDRVAGGNLTRHKRAEREARRFAGVSP